MAAADETWKTTVFVGRLPQGVTEAELTTKFSSVGSVKSVTPASVAKTSFLIEMSTEAEAAAAADELGGQPLREGDDRGMRVNLARAPLERVANPRGVFVRNLPRSATEESVRGIFAGVGTIESLELIPRRGAAEILFTEEAALAPALAKSEGVMDGRTFYVEQQQKAVNPPKRTRRRKRAGGAAAPAAAEAAPQRAAPVSNPRKVRVSGLAAGTTEDAVSAFAAAAGEVARVKVVESEASGLHAYVTFAEAAGAEGAVATLNGGDLNGAAVTVEADKGRVRRRRRKGRAAAEGGDGAAAPAAPAVADPKRVWVGNVPAGLDQEVIVGRFTEFGEVARFQRRRKTLRYCYVTFTTEEAAQAALGATIEIDGDVLKLEPSSASKPRSARPGRRAVPSAAAE